MRFNCFTGFAQRSCSDSVAQAFSGLVSVNVGADGIPHRVGATLSDVCTGLYGFQAVSTALFARATVGKGRRIDIGLTQSTAALLGHKFAEYALEGGTPRLLNVPAGSYGTGDSWLMVTLVTEAQYKRLCSVLSREDLAKEPRFANFALRAECAEELAAELRKVFATDSTDFLAGAPPRGGHHHRPYPESFRMAGQRTRPGDARRAADRDARRGRGLRRACVAHLRFTSTIRACCLQPTIRKLGPGLIWNNALRARIT